MSEIGKRDFSWDDKGVAKNYIDSINPLQEREIQITKENYHDPIFYTLLPDLSHGTTLDVGCGNYYMTCN